MIHINPRKTFQRRINELKSRNTEWASFAAAMKYPLNFVEERFKRLKLDGRPVGVIPYPVDDTFKVLTDALVEFDPAFDPNIRSKSQISKMSRNEKFLASPENFRLSEYTLQYILCGKEG